MAGEKRRLICSTIAVSLVGIVTGLFLGGGLMPSQASNQMYNETTTISKTELSIVHAHDDVTQHEHPLITVVTVTETTPHGYFHDFATAMVPQGLTTMPTDGTPKQTASEVWVVASEFKPHTLTVPVGTKVTWVNKEGEEHEVTSVKPGIFSNPLVPFGSYSYTFNEPGTYDYYCGPHSSMTGVIIVK